MLITKIRKAHPLLQIAVNNDSVDLVKLLLESGSSVKTKDQYGLTALVYAYKRRNPEIVKLIKDAGGSY